MSITQTFESPGRSVISCNICLKRKSVQNGRRHRTRCFPFHTNVARKTDLSGLSNVCVVDSVPSYSQFGSNRFNCEFNLFITWKANSLPLRHCSTARNDCLVPLQIAFSFNISTIEDIGPQTHISFSTIRSLLSSPKDPITFVTDSGDVCLLTVFLPDTFFLALTPRRRLI